MRKSTFTIGFRDSEQVMMYPAYLPTYLPRIGRLPLRKAIKNLKMSTRNLCCRKCK